MFQQQIEKWLKEFVLGLNLCPFAHEPFQTQRIRITICESMDEKEVIQFLLSEIILLNKTARKSLETSLLGIPNLWESFDKFWPFMEWTHQLLAKGQLEEHYQLVGFHPDYIFAGPSEDDHANFTNRSPFPIIHILRQDSVEEAVSNHPNPNLISEKNISTLRQISRQQLEQLAFQRSV